MFGLGTAATLFGVTIVVSLLGLYVAPRIIERNLFRPYWFQRRGDYWTALTSGFVHADLTHLLFNMMTFYFFAFPLERTIGPLRLLALYLLALVLSNLGTFLKQRNNPDYASLGASGAISAVLFAFVVYYPTSSFFFYFVPVPIPATVFAVLYLGVHVVSRAELARPHQPRRTSRRCADRPRVCSFYRALGLCRRAATARRLRNCESRLYPDPCRVASRDGC